MKTKRPPLSPVSSHGSFSILQSHLSIYLHEFGEIFSIIILGLLGINRFSFTSDYHILFETHAEIIWCMEILRIWTVPIPIIRLWV